MPDDNPLGPHLEAIKAGQWENLDFPWSILTKQARALHPGSICVLCGEPGATKSMLMLWAAFWWHWERMETISLAALEGGAELHLHRLLAMLANNWDILDAAWCMSHPEIVELAYKTHVEKIESFNKQLIAPPAANLRYPVLLEWLKVQLNDGSKVLIIDPITAVDAGDERHTADQRFILQASQLIADHAARLILVTHPRSKVFKQPSLSDMAGGMAFSRHTQSVLWLTSGEKRVTIDGPNGPEPATCNRTIKILKSTHGPGLGKRIAYHLGADMRFHELGIIRAEHRKQTEPDSDPAAYDPSKLF